MRLPTVVVSSEWLFAHLVARGTGSHVLRFFRESGLEPEILIYIRPDAERINSGFVQQTRCFSNSDPLPLFAVARAKRAAESYPRLIALKEALGPKLTILPYDTEVAERGAVRSFLAAIGVSEEEQNGFEPERRVNESLGPIAVEAARSVLIELRESGREPPKQARRTLGTALLELVRGEPPEASFQGVDDRLAARIDAEVTAERERFAAAVWGKPWAEVFPPSHRRPCNAFDAETAGVAEVERYRRFLEALSARAEAVVTRARSGPVRGRRGAPDRRRPGAAGA